MSWTEWMPHIPVLVIYHSVLKCTGVFQGMFRIPSSKNIPSLVPESFGVSHFWDYAKQCYHDADNYRHRMGLDQAYLAVHWRSETSQCDFSACSEMLASGVRSEQKKRGWSYDVNTPRRCLLVSDIPYNTSEVLWCMYALPICAFVASHGSVRFL